MIKKKVNTELGRSMVEMLGTLAIMGVLTIGGIAGYRYAINKSNANTILNAVSQMAVTASTELTTQGSLTLPEWKDVNGNLSISGAYGVETAQNNDGTFSIIVSDMNDEVCERIKGMDWKVPEDVAINDETGVCDQGEANTIEFVFSNTLGKKSESESSDDLKSCSSQADCPYCHTCTGGKCVPDTLCDNSCPPDKPVLENNGNCSACPTEFMDYTSFSASSAAECSKCSFKGFSFTYRNNECVLSGTTCPDGYFYSYQGQNCQSCTSGVYTHHQTHEQNLKCVEECKGVRSLTSAGGWGESCDASCSGEGQFYDSWGFCRDCANTTQYWGSCSSNKCPGKSFSKYDYSDQCVIDCPNRNFGENVGRCCEDDEVYTDIGTKRYGHQYGACCPKTRPNWNGSKCVP